MAITGKNIILKNEDALRARLASGTATDILKLDASDVLKVMKLPRIDAAAPAPSNAKDLVTKEYADSAISSGVLDLIGEPDGIAPLGPDGKIPNQFYSSLVITDVFVVADIAARDALSAIEEGDVAKVIDAGAGLPKTYIYGGSAWIEIESGSDVDSVNGYTGNVVLVTSDIAESGITNLYYTPARKAAIEAYADQAEADAIASANSYTDAEVAILEGEDLTFLKLDGSRPMTGALDMNGQSISAAGAVTATGAVQGGQLITTADLLIDGIQLQKLLTGELSIASSIKVGGDVDLQSTNKVINLVDPANAQDAATKNYVDGEVSALETEDLTFLKLDGSRPMTGSLDMDGSAISNAASVSATGAISGGRAIVGTLGIEIDGVSISKLGTDFVMGAGLELTGNLNLTDSYKVVNLVDPVDAQDAATKNYVDARETAITAAYEAYADQAEVDAKAYTDAQLDTLSVFEQAYKAVTLSGAQITAQAVEVDHAIVGTPWIQVNGRVMLEPGVDFTWSGTTISFAGPVATGGDEALAATDRLAIFYHKSVSPFV